MDNAFFFKAFLIAILSYFSLYLFKSEHTPTTKFLGVLAFPMLFFSLFPSFFYLLTTDDINTITLFHYLTSPDYCAMQSIGFVSGVSLFIYQANKGKFNFFTPRLKNSPFAAVKTSIENKRRDKEYLQQQKIREIELEIQREKTRQAEIARQEKLDELEHKRPGKEKRLLDIINRMDDL